MADVSNKKSVKKWVILLVMPIPILILSTVLRSVAISKFTTVTSEPGAALEVSTQPTVQLLISISSLLNVFCIVLILLIPLWIVLLVRDSNANKQQNP